MGGRTTYGRASPGARPEPVSLPKPCLPGGIHTPSLVETTRAEATTIKQIDDRLRRVPRILAAQNIRLGRPLDEHDLADLSQDTALIILQKLHLFADGAPLEAWVYRVCTMEIRNGMRRKCRRAQPHAIDSIDALSDPSVSIRDHVAMRELVVNAVDRLEAVEAEVVRLKHYEGLTFDEIAGRLEVPTSTLKTRYYRALSRLQRLLQSAHES